MSEEAEIRKTPKGIWETGGKIVAKRIDPTKKTGSGVKTFSIEKYGREKCIELAKLWMKEDMKMTIETPISGHKENIEWLDPTVFDTKGERGYTMTIVGQSDSGKSYFLKDLYKKVFKEYVTVIFTHSVTSPLGKVDGDLLVKYKKFNPAVVTTARALNNIFENKVKFLMICDDCSGHKQNRTMEEMFTEMRNDNIVSIQAAQRLKMLNPNGRGNSHYILMFSLGGSNDIFDLYEEYLSMIVKFRGVDRKDLAVEWYREMTRDHHFLVLRTSDSKLFRYKVQD